MKGNQRVRVITVKAMDEGTVEDGTGEKWKREEGWKGGDWRDKG